MSELEQSRYNPSEKEDSQKYLFDMVSNIANQMAQWQDAVIRKAVTHHLGHTRWSIQQLSGKLFIFKNYSSNTETLVYEETKLIEFFPWKIEKQGSMINVSREYRLLYKEGESDSTLSGTHADNPSVHRL
jgi:hypothetical protein